MRYDKSMPEVSESAAAMQGAMDALRALKKRFLDKYGRFLRMFYDAAFLLAFACCLLPGAFPALKMPAAAVVTLCYIVSFADDNFYLYAALFISMRYVLLLGGTPSYRLYSYLVVLKLLVDVLHIRLRIAYFPMLLVVILHSVFALGRFDSMRVAFNIIVDCVLIYMIMTQVTRKPELFRRFVFAMLLAGVASGVYGWTNADTAVDINIAGAGAHTVNRNFGSLSDANFAGLYYSLCTIMAIVVKGYPKLLLWGIAAINFVLLLQTASLSGLMIFFALILLLMILKFRGKSIIIITITGILGAVGLVILLSVPQFRNIQAIAGLIIRIEEKLGYLARGRFDLLTTDRTAIWAHLGEYFRNESLFKKLLGGNVITVAARDETITDMACHNSYLQSVMNFGILGTLVVYLPAFGVFGARLFRHFNRPKQYEYEDVAMIRILLLSSFFIFGLTVDFFIDWPYMLFYFV